MLKSNPADEHHITNYCVDFLNSEIKIDAGGELARLGLNDHLSAQRSNGVRAMVERIRKTALAAA